jgi:hypothetical protein
MNSAIVRDMGGIIKGKVAPVLRHLVMKVHVENGR